MVSCYSSKVEFETISTLSTDTVLINPEAKRHVRIYNEIGDSTTANIGVVISVTVLELNKYITTNKVDNQLTNCFGCAARNGDVSVEHVVNG